AATSWCRRTGMDERAMAATVGSAGDAARCWRPAEKRSQSFTLVGQGLPEPGTAWGFSGNVPRFDDQLLSAGRYVRPTNDLLTPEQRKRVIAPTSLRGWRVRLESIRPLPQQLEPAAIPHDRIERREQTN